MPIALGSCPDMKPSTRLRWSLALLALTATLAVARPPDQDDRRPRDHRERIERSERPDRPRVRVSLDRAVAMAERRFNARVVRADTRDAGDRVVYVLRLLNEAGRVWTVRVDASTGEMQ